MGFLGRGIGTALLGPAGYVLGNQFDQDKGVTVPGAPNFGPPKKAKDIGISPDLESALGDIGTAATGAIAKNYQDMGSRRNAELATLGRRSGSDSYSPQRMGVQQGLDVGNLEGALGGVEGNAAYKNALEERGYGQDMALANEIASLNKPDLLQQIFGGVGAVGKPIATYAGMKGPRRSSAAPTSEWDGLI